MKIKDIVKEAEVTLKPMPGAQEVDIDGKAIGTATTPAAATAISDLAKKGEFTANNSDQTQQASEHVDNDTIDSGNHDVGGDGTDQFINDVRAADSEEAMGYGPEQSTEEGFLGLGNKSAEEWAKVSTQMAQLLQLRAKYKGTQYEQQIEQRINLLKDRLDLDAGEVAGPDGNPKPVVPPEQFNTNQLKENDELSAMLRIAGLK